VCVASGHISHACTKDKQSLPLVHSSYMITKTCRTTGRSTRTFSIPRPRRVNALPTPSGVLTPTVSSLILPSEIGRSDLAISRDSRYCPREINCRNPDGQRSMSRISVLSLSGYRDLRCRCLALQQPERRNADLTRTRHLDSNITLGPHAATSTSGFRGSRIHDSKSLAVGNPECRNSEVSDLCHLSLQRSTAQIQSGNRTSRF
jgi:hypothetical protein